MKRGKRDPKNEINDWDLELKSDFITIEDWDLLTVVSAEYVSKGYIHDESTMDQRWINDASTIIYNVSHTKKYTRSNVWTRMKLHGHVNFDIQS